MQRLVFGVDPKTFEDRFWQKVHKTDDDGCWEWAAGLNRWGYGEIKIAKKTRKAHHAAFLLSGGEIPDGQVLRHTCDNTKCVRPSHLVPGTHVDNVRDRCERDRSARGLDNGRTKLDDAKVLQIRELHAYGFTKTELARLFNVDRKNIHFIVIGKTWRHVPMPTRQPILENTEKTVASRPGLC